MSRNLARAVAAVVALGLAFGVGQAEAARHAGRHVRHRIVEFAPGPVRESIVIDAVTGQILSEDNPDGLTYPASLTKLMTLYLTFQALDSGRLRLDTRLPVSAWAASQSPTKLGLRPGDTVSVRSLILGIVTRSANDAAVVLAEGIGGSEPAFADEMNAAAQRLGMTRTFFRNASGLPNPEQHTTARDIARLALALIRDFPREYGFFDTKEFDFRGTEVVGHDHLLNWYPGADGMKTGFIRASGFNLVTSAVQGGHRLIGVVLGGATWAARDREMAALLDQAFAGLATAAPVATRAPAPAPLPPRPMPIPAVARVAAPVEPPPPPRTVAQRATVPVP
ncbi:MAG: D-alanyl-D-alanine carboxypeptidase family protein, partial [Stellaceae bacterium]